MALRKRLAMLGVCAWLGMAGCGGGSSEPYDIVLSGGRVMDPESGLDAVRHVGIRGDRIAAVSTDPLRGAVEVDVSGLVVAPGFIDLHAHMQDLEGNRWQVRDGVTTALEMEGGVWPVAEWYAERAKTGLINYGATVSHVQARIRHITGATSEDDPAIGRLTPAGSPAWSHQPIEPEAFPDLVALVEQGIREGGLGIGMGINYTPAASPQEIYRLFELAAANGIPIYVHVRGMGLIEPAGSFGAIQEMLSDALTSGASLHIVHLGSSGLSQAPKLATMIDAARARGVDVTTEVYPYAAASTNLEAAIFDPGWRERLGVDYDAIEWAATGERLTAATFARYRRQGGRIIAYVIPEAAVDSLIAHPGIMIASDAVPLIDGRGHPRGVGTYARVLGRYVRERQALTLMEALRKMSYLPAERLRPAVPEMERKGRIKVGADADLTMFDPARVIDRATFDNPTQASAGIPHVMVNGVFVVRDGQLVEGVLPGRPVRRTVPPAP